MQDFFKVKHTTFIVERAFSFFSLMTPLVRFFQPCLLRRNFFLEIAFPLPIKKIIVRPLAIFSALLSNQSTWNKLLDFFLSRY